MNFRQDRPADLDRTRAAVIAWREQNRAGTADQLITAIGSRFPPGYGAVLHAVLFSLDRDVPAEAGRYLAVIAARLAAEGIACHVTRDGTLTAEKPGSAPNPVSVVIDTAAGPGFWIDCTCAWTPPPASTPHDIADSVLAVIGRASSTLAPSDEPADTIGGLISHPGRPHDVTALSTRELERVRRDLAASLSLSRPGSTARAMILAHIIAVDTERAQRSGPPGITRPESGG